MITGLELRRRVDPAEMIMGEPTAESKKRDYCAFQQKPKRGLFDDEERLFATTIILSSCDTHDI